jgi:hypothetical protein
MTVERFDRGRVRSVNLPEMLDPAIGHPPVLRQAVDTVEVKALTGDRERLLVGLMQRDCVPAPWTPA